MIFQQTSDASSNMILYLTVLGTSPSPLPLLPWTMLLFPRLGKNSTYAVYHDTFCTISCFNFHLFTVNYKLSLFGQDLRGIVASPSLFSIRLKSSTLTRWQFKSLCLTALSFFASSSSPPSPSPSSTPISPAPPSPLSSSGRPPPASSSARATSAATCSAP